MVLSDLKEDAHVIEIARQEGVLVRRSRLDPPKPDIHTLDTRIEKDSGNKGAGRVWNEIELKN